MQTCTRALAYHVLLARSAVLLAEHVLVDLQKAVLCCF